VFHYHSIPIRLEGKGFDIQIKNAIARAFGQVLAVAHFGSYNSSASKALPPFGGF
jgi:hypothetical protein